MHVALTDTPELLATCHWGWSASRLEKLLDELEHGGVVVGIAQNQWEHIDRFDGLVLLEMDEVTQRQRVASRNPLVREQILAGLPELQSEMIARGAFRIDAGQPPAVVAGQVIAFVSER